MIYANIFVYFYILITELADFRTPSWQISPLGNPAGSHLNRYVKNQLGVNPNEVRK